MPTLTISVTGGVVSISAQPFPIKPTKKLSWTCNDGAFAVFFKNNRSPFSTVNVIAGDDGDTTTGLKIRNLSGTEQGSAVNDPINGATFSYGIAVLNGGTIRTLDPDVIIDDPGGGGPRKKKSAGGKKKK
jgi:hypothetical protein